MSRKIGNRHFLVCHHLIFATLLIAKRIIWGALVGEIFPYRPKFGAPKVLITFH
jgi:hypothetical protein